jgi:hypothetical protein
VSKMPVYCELKNYPHKKPKTLTLRLVFSLNDPVNIETLSCQNMKLKC